MLFPIFTYSDTTFNKVRLNKGAVSFVKRYILLCHFVSSNKKLLSIDFGFLVVLSFVPLTIELGGYIGFLICYKIVTTTKN